MFVPVEDLGEPVFRFSHEYKIRTAIVTLKSIMEYGDVCLVFKGIIIFVSTELLVFLQSLDQREAFRQCKANMPTALDSARQSLIDHHLNPSYVDVVYKMDSDTDYSKFSLEYHKISMSFEDLAEELPACVQAKLQQMDSRRDWSRWDQDDVGAFINSYYTYLNTS